MRTVVSHVFASLLVAGVLVSLPICAPAQDSWNVDLLGGIGGQFGAVHVEGSYAYCVAPQGLLVVVDVSNVFAPREVGRVSFSDQASDVYVSGGYAYVANGLAGLRVIDVSAPDHPREVGYFDTPGYATGAYVWGAYAYVVDGGSGLAGAGRF